jgi:ubiquinone/menaquinone biosynthesis C-methylase UbiE
MKNEFMTDQEYEECFVEFWGIRSNIAHTLTEYGLKPGISVLDVPAGHGFFSYEVAKVIQRGEIHAVGLKNDLESFERFSRSLKTESERYYLDMITYSVMDAVNLGFPSEIFDFVVNFLGLEDINMTRGKKGVKKSLSEFVRVLTCNGVIQVTVCIEGDEPDQVIAKEVMDYLGAQAVFYPKEFYVQELETLGVSIVAEKWFHTHKKMTAKQAEEELRFACDEPPKIFSDYNVTTVPFDELWDKFGSRIETHGMAYYSDLCVLIGRK